MTKMWVVISYVEDCTDTINLVGVYPTKNLVHSAILSEIEEEYKKLSYLERLTYVESNDDLSWMLCEEWPEYIEGPENISWDRILLRFNDAMFYADENIKGIHRTYRLIKEIYDY